MTPQSRFLKYQAKKEGEIEEAKTNCDTVKKRNRHTIDLSKKIQDEKELYEEFGDFGNRLRIWNTKTPDNPQPRYTKDPVYLSLFSAYHINSQDNFSPHIQHIIGLLLSGIASRKINEETYESLENLTPINIRRKLADEFSRAYLSLNKSHKLGLFYDSSTSKFEVIKHLERKYLGGKQ